MVLAEKLVKPIDRKVIVKNIKKVMNQFVKVSGVVAQIQEDDDSAATWMLVMDKNDDCWKYVTIGSVSILEDDHVTIVGMPIEYGAFDNLEGTSTEFVSLLGGYVIKK